MGAGLRRATRTVGIAIVLTLAIPAAGDEFAACWSDFVLDPISGVEEPITRCRIAGGEIVDYGSDGAVPAVLFPAAGTDLTGDCWFLTSRSSNWIYLNRYVNGDATLGWDPDPAIPGGVAFATGRIPRCTSEPNLWNDPTAEVWEYVMAYIHPPPTPDVNPKVGDGVTGLETYVGVPVPIDHNANLSAAGVSLEVEIAVDGVSVEWGDGEVETFPADTEALAGYPDGIARHIYEIKQVTGYPLAVSYDWTARWRVPGGAWQFLGVPDTTTTVDYPVSEIISVLTP